MLLAKIAELPRPARIDLLGALRGPSVQDDGSMDDHDLLEEIAQALRDLLGADEGQLTQILRERLAFVAESLDATHLLQGAPDLMSSLDLVDDDRIAWAIAEWVGQQAHAFVEEEEQSIVVVALGRRFLASNASVRAQRALDVVRLQDLTKGTDRTYKERQLVVAQVQAGKPPLTMEPARSDLSVANLIGLWICDALYDAADGPLQSPDPQRDDAVVSIAVQPVADLIAAWVLSREEISASSSRTRAQWSRTARAIAAVSLTVLAYAGQPEQLVDPAPRRVELPKTFIDALPDSSNVEPPTSKRSRVSSSIKFSGMESAVNIKRSDGNDAYTRTNPSSGARRQAPDSGPQVD